MIQLMQLDSADEKAVRAYRLQVKARIYRFNKVCAPKCVAVKQPSNM